MTRKRNFKSDTKAKPIVHGKFTNKKEKQLQLFWFVNYIRKDNILQ